MTKSAINRDQLEAHLIEQLQFLELSCNSFDAGFEAEAKRLAVTLRVLLHDTAQSHSLLGQLEKRPEMFCDTAMSSPTNTMVPFSNLVFQAFNPTGVTYVAMLDNVPSLKDTPFEEWWDGATFVDEKLQKISRRHLVLTAANQDGGAHVDPALDNAYGKFAHSNALGWAIMANGQSQPMGDPTRAAIRQISHEALKTLKPGYEKQPRQHNMVMGGFTLSMVKPDSE